MDGNPRRQNFNEKFPPNIADNTNQMSDIVNVTGIESQPDAVIDSSRAVVNIRDEKETADPFAGRSTIGYRNSYVDSPTNESFENDQSIAYTGYPSFSDRLEISAYNGTKNEKAKEQTNNLCTDVAVCNQEHVEEIINLKKEIEDSENTFDNNIVRHDQESFVIDINCNVNDSSPRPTKETAGLDIPIKQEVVDPAYNFGNEVEKLGCNENENCAKIKLEKTDIQNDFTTVNNEHDGNSNTIFTMQRSDNGNIRFEKNDQIQLVTSVMFTVVSRLPQNELNQCSSTTENSKLEDDDTNIDVSRLDKKDLLLNQNDYIKVCEAYLNSLSNNVEHGQKMFKICSKVQEKETGRPLLTSKYCTIIPKIVKPALGNSKNGNKKNVHKRSKTAKKGNHSKGNAFIALKRCLTSTAKTEQKGTENERTVMKYICHCGISFYDRDEYLEHKRKDHWTPKEFTCEDCNKSYSKWRDYSRHICFDSKQEQDFVCSICDERFESDQSLQFHTNNEKKKRKCKNCDKVFCSLKDLTCHLQKEHLKYSCKVCSQTFYTRWKLGVHFGSVHTSLKCEFCNKMFANSAYKKRHIERKHVNDQFKCNECDAKFVNKQLLENHKCIENCMIQNSETLNLRKDDIQQSRIDTISSGRSVEDDENIEKDVTKIEGRSIPTRKDVALALISIVSEGSKDAVCEYTNVIKAEGLIRTELLKSDDIPETPWVGPSKVVEENKLTTPSTDSLDMQPHNIKTESGISDQKIITVNDTIKQEKAEMNSLCENNKHVKKSKILLDQGYEKKDGTNKRSINYHDKAVLLSDTGNENLDSSQGSTFAGRPKNEDKLVISNSLFKKRDEASQFGQKRKNREEKEDCKKSSVENKGKECKEIKTDRKNIVDLKEKLFNIKHKLQKITRKVPIKQSLTKPVDKSVNSTNSPFDEGYAIGQTVVAKIKHEKSGEDKKNSVIGEKSAENHEVIIIESSDEEVDNLTGKHSAVFNSHEKGIEDESDNTNSETEDDGEYEEEMIISRADVKENAIHKGGLHITRNLDTEFNELSTMTEEEQKRGKWSTNKPCEVNNYHYAPKRKSELKNDMISSMKLRKVSVVLTDIFKSGKQHFDISAKDFNKQKEIDYLCAAASSDIKILNSITSQDIAFRSVELRNGELSDDDMSSESASDDDDDEGYEECAIEDL